MIAPPRRHAKNSVSEGELTDEVARAERVVRQRNKFISGIPGRQQQPDHGATLSRPHRVVSGDRDRSVHLSLLTHTKNIFVMIVELKIFFSVTIFTEN